jgi:hypothetical protein
MVGTATTFTFLIRSALLCPVGSTAPPWCASRLAPTCPTRAAGPGAARWRGAWAASRARRATPAPAHRAVLTWGLGPRRCLRFHRRRVLPLTKVKLACLPTISTQSLAEKHELTLKCCPACVRWQRGPRPNGPRLHTRADARRRWHRLWTGRYLQLRCAERQFRQRGRRVSGMA